MSKYILLCKECKKEFMSFEKYEMHVYEDHKDKLYLRFKPEILKRL